MLEENQAIASVTVIIPCYCCTETIERAVLSVVNQTVKPAELILIDDGSNDGTPAFLKQLRKDYGEQWIKVIKLDDDYGVSVARNVGWEAASGDYVAFLDADDAWHRDKVAVQYTWMKNHPDVMLSGHAIVIKPKILDTEIPPSELKVKLISKRQLLISNVFVMSSLMVKRDCPIRFHPSLRYSQDYHFHLQVILRGGKAVVMNYPIVYRFNAPYGESGLTKNLAALAADELEVYRKVWQAKQIHSATYFVLYLWSLIRYLRRLYIHSLRQLTLNFSQG